MEVKYFMWGFQPHFLMSASHLFDVLCMLVGCDLKPSLFLVGFLQGKPKGFLPICVGPDDCAYQPEIFKDVVAKAQEAAEAPREMIIKSPSEWHAEDYERRYRLGCLAGAVLEAVKAKTDPSRTPTYCTRMVRVENYLVSLVLQIDRAARDAWPHLGKRLSNLGGVPVSLIDCLIEVFLDTCADDLSKPEPGRWIGETKDWNSMVRAAGRNFMYKRASNEREFVGGAEGGGVGYPRPGRVTVAGPCGGSWRPESTPRYWPGCARSPCSAAGSGPTTLTCARRATASADAGSPSPPGGAGSW
jgi:hypothetical protein